jgi:hypothetical protein
MPQHALLCGSLYECGLVGEFQLNACPHVRIRRIIVLMSDDVTRTKRGRDLNQYIYFHGRGINVFNNAC